MVAAGLCIGLDGVGHVFPPYFIPPETKINAARYQDMLRSYYDPWAKTFCGADAVFQQDGAPSHTARTTRALLGEMFRETLVWPALSSNLSPDDCALWAATSQLHCVELFEHDKHVKTDPTVDDFSSANEGIA